MLNKLFNWIWRGNSDLFFIQLPARAPLDAAVFISIELFSDRMEHCRSQKIKWQTPLSFFFCADLDLVNLLIGRQRLVVLFCIPGQIHI